MIKYQMTDMHTIEREFASSVSVWLELSTSKRAYFRFLRPVFTPPGDNSNNIECKLRVSQRLSVNYRTLCSDRYCSSVLYQSETKSHQHVRHQ